MISRSGNTDEKTFNGFLAAALGARHPRWSVDAEKTKRVRGRPGKQPDIIIRPGGGKAGVPVVIETEYEPASSVEKDAAGRIGFSLTGTRYVVHQVVAVRIPGYLRKLPTGALTDAIDTAQFEYGLLSEPKTPLPAPVSVTDLVRFPASGWITGTVDDLAGFCERIALNEHQIDEAANELETAIEGVTGDLRRALLPERRGALDQVAATLNQTDSAQTTRMCVALIANALLFQTAIAGTPDPRGGAIPTPQPGDSRIKTMETWDEILEINYWPIFAIARQLLAVIPDAETKQMITGLTRMISELSDYGVTSTGDMAGQMFGRLITDRKFLATFYTLPASAHLLAELAVARLGADWSQEDQIKSLRVADLACGTGTLLCAAYQRVMARARRHADIDTRRLHSEMMERSLIAADIMPAAVHLTATLLSSLHPAVTFGDTRVFLMPYGEDDRGTHIGSLELLDDHFATEAWGWGGGVPVSGHNDQTGQSVIAHHEADLVIMNPPFTRPTSHETADSAAVPVPSFAGFDTAADEQRAMAKRLAAFKRKLGLKASHGNAGLASNFIDLAHIKTKPGGTLAVVLPQAVVRGGAWSAARDLLTREYRDICVVSLAATGSTNRAFSADTGIAEALIIATKKIADDSPADGPSAGGVTADDLPADAVTADDLPADDLPANGVMFVNLDRRPANLVEGVEIARYINTIPATGSGTLKIGGTAVGSYTHAASLTDAGSVAVTEPDLSMFATALADRHLWLPRLGELKSVRLTRLVDLGERGPVDRDIGRPDTSSAPLHPTRGPFTIEPATRWQSSAFPCLWSHDHKKETRLIVEPDTRGRIRHGHDDQARKIWATASRLHFTRDFQLNSQPLTACVTPTPCLGGRAWPSFTPESQRWENLLVLWANTTPGLVAWWWIATRQQQGRASITISRLPQLPVLDPRTLTDTQLADADNVFETFSRREFLPANESYRDSTRQDLDESVLVGLLGCDKTILPSLTVIRDQWCRQPSVHGGKSTRP